MGPELCFPRPPQSEFEASVDSSGHGRECCIAICSRAFAEKCWRSPLQQAPELHISPPRRSGRAGCETSWLVVVESLFRGGAKLKLDQFPIRCPAHNIIVQAAPPFADATYRVDARIIAQSAAVELDLNSSLHHLNDKGSPQFTASRGVRQPIRFLSVLGNMIKARKICSATTRALLQNSDVRRSHVSHRGNERNSGSDLGSDS
ncbi:hypothetical protein NA57DRAFT_59456 [Rhizodiscina lignyota]|uniref:Uncharacterized protein n=1 Tax=Rhizodiscina lignyota TaxID=1504668 RepID=A0A9P4IAN3_9PEZI|nr:hypothetical protein NA57DRAFT_59456 [Rhizodiscina lignyota]